MKILITGSTGFLGGAIERSLQNNADNVLSVALRNSRVITTNSTVHVVGSISGETDWSEALRGQDIVIHAAACTRVTNKKISGKMTEYSTVNVDGTLRLAEQSAVAGLKRFIFISTIKVNGEETQNCHAFTPFHKPEPLSAYAQSKWQAEQGLNQIGLKTGMEIVIIRPPLIYGKGVSGNFAALNKLVKIGLPLPFSNIHNKRTMIGINNLINLIELCVIHPLAAKQVLMVGDGHDMSTAEMLLAIGRATDRTVRLFPIPEKLFFIIAKMTGISAIVQRVTGSLKIDISHTCELLKWTPPFTVEEEIKSCFK